MQTPSQTAALEAVLDSSPGIARTIAFWAAVGLIFVIPIENMFDVGEVGTLGRAVGLLVVAVWIAAVLLSGKVRRPHLFHVVACLFVMWNAASVLWTVDLDETTAHLLTYFQLLGLSMILWDLFPTRESLRIGLQAYVLGACVSVASIVANYLSGTRFSHIRYSAAGFHVDSIGVIFALAVPMAVYLAASRDSGWAAPLWRWLNFAYLPAAFVGIVLTGTRTAMVATLPALLLAIAMAGKVRPVATRSIMLVVLAGSVWALHSFVPPESLERLASTGDSIASGDLSGRGRIWRDCLELVAENPVLGIGSGAIRTALDTRRVAHNSFLSVLTEVGLVGLVLFVAMVAIAFDEARRQPRFEARFWLALLIAWGLGASMLTWETRKQTWLVLSLAVASASAVSTSGSASPASGPRART